VKKIRVTVKNFSIHHTVLYYKREMLLYKVCFERLHENRKKNRSTNDWMRIRRKYWDVVDVYGNYVIDYGERRKPATEFVYIYTSMHGHTIIILSDITYV